MSNNVIMAKYNDDLDGVVADIEVNGKVYNVAVQDVNNPDSFFWVDDVENPDVEELWGEDGYAILREVWELKNMCKVGNWEEEGFPRFPHTYGMVELERTLKNIAKNIARKRTRKYENLTKDEDGFLTCPELEKTNEEIKELKCKADKFIFALGHAYAAVGCFEIYTDAINAVDTWVNHIILEQEKLFLSALKED